MFFSSESNTKIPSEKMSNEKEDSDVEEMDHESEESEASGSVSGGESSDTSDSDEASGSKSFISTSNMLSCNTNVCFVNFRTGRRIRSQTTDLSFEDVRIGETVHGITRCVCDLRISPQNLSIAVLLLCFYFRIINERLKQISLKLAEIQSGEAPEYLQPLAELEDNMRIRLEVAGVLRKFRLKNLDNQYEAEELTAKQNFEVCNRN